MTILHHQPLQVIPGETDQGSLPDDGFPDALAVYSYIWDVDALDWTKATAASVGGALTDGQLRASAVPVSISGGATAANQTTGNTSLASIDATLGATLIMSLDADSNHNPLYLGTAVKGTTTAQALWQIRKFTIDGNNNVSAIRYANGSAASDQIWDNRAALAYS